VDDNTTDRKARRRPPYGTKSGGGRAEDELTVQETATYLGRSTEQVRRYLRDGALVGYRVGQQWFIPRRELEEFRITTLGAPKMEERRQLVQEVRALRERLLARYGYFDVRTWVRDAREGLD
jgi:excisionase family DNA binding protein